MGRCRSFLVLVFSLFLSNFCCQIMKIYLILAFLVKHFVWKDCDQSELPWNILYILFFVKSTDYMFPWIIFADFCENDVKIWDFSFLTKFDWSWNLKRIKFSHLSKIFRNFWPHLFAEVSKNTKKVSSQLKLSKNVLYFLLVIQITLRESTPSGYCLYIYIYIYMYTYIYIW